MAEVKGIDVSHHQGEIDWEAVASAGIAFAYAKATDGTSFKDSRFVENWANMRTAGLYRGAYHFFRPARDPEDQAAAFLATMGSLGQNDLPPMLDIEETPGTNEWAAFPQAKRVDLVSSWIDVVQRETGLIVVLYTRRGFMQQMLGAAGRLGDCPLWVAHYTTQGQPAIPVGWDTWTFWQYTEKGQVSGIAGNVDLDRFNGSLDDLGKLTKQPLSNGVTDEGGT